MSSYNVINYNKFLNFDNHDNQILVAHYQWAFDGTNLAPSIAVLLVYSKFSASVSPLLVTSLEIYENLASTLSVIAAKSSNSSFLAAVEV